VTSAFVVVVVNDTGSLIGDQLIPLSRALAVIV
jgi:hypothetical protein